MSSAERKMDNDSIVSGFSMISLNGEEMSAEAALDAACRDIQTTVNELHSYARQLLMADERGDTREEIMPLFTNVSDLLKDGVDLFKEFKAICKQMLPPAPRKPKKVESNPDFIKTS